jgi:hypothetical protein
MEPSVPFVSSCFIWVIRVFRGKLFGGDSPMDPSRRLPSVVRQGTLSHKVAGRAADNMPKEGVMTGNRSRGVWAVLRNALTWGVAWAVAGGAIVTVLSLFYPGPGVESLLERLGMAILSGISWGVRFGIAGAVIGTIFSSVIRFAYRGRRLADINPLRFALLGAVVGGVGVPLFLQTMNVLSGDGPVAWGLVVDDAVWASVFGAAAAAGFLLLARRADALTQNPPRDQLEPVDDLDTSPTAGRREASISQRSGSAS